MTTIPMEWRQSIVSKLNEALPHHSKWINDFEIQLHNRYSSDPETYQCEAVRLGLNLLQNADYLTKTWTPDQFVSSNLSDDDLSKTTELDQQDQLDRQKNVQFQELTEETEQKLSQSGGIGTCKCGSSKVSYMQKQTRSADEPMTVFIQCQKCGNRWRA
jgi:transcription elongation factor S-II